MDILYYEGQNLTLTKRKSPFMPKVTHILIFTKHRFKIRNVARKCYYSSRIWFVSKKTCQGQKNWGCRLPDGKWKNPRWSITYPSNQWFIGQIRVLAIFYYIEFDNKWKWHHETSKKGIQGWKRTLWISTHVLWIKEHSC